ncbi:MAG: OFA family MFS transporter [Candidatus Dadabacteria bacterium]|nr:OFA family MFS transporter [Candidatus Dadabacteria bacterium]NIS08421.1 OFA family MFS transporter [Candidatus Dadabacteria bacterium]NIV41986.1 MFS transporter [Candidatus Dadabacteria bacterium]NIX15292.1 MFS transporter [Candidatus Dadabacteria bacterium]NIY21909.1 MFS transporter [Candidatus Dadabacteria bacterium]
MAKNKLFYGWYIVAASLILIILDGLLLYSFGIFLPGLNDKFGLSEAGGSSVYALRSFVLAFSLAISGRLVDKYDPRIIIFSGGLICAIALLLCGFAETKFELFLYFGVLIGIGDGVLYITCVTLISRWFVKKRSLAIGIITTGVPLSGLFVPPLTTWLIINHGISNAFFGLSAFIFIAIFAALLLRKSPAEMNLKPYGAEDIGSENDSAQITHDQKQQDWEAKEAFHTPAFWLLYIIWFFGFITFLIIITHLFNYEIHVGIPEMLASGAPAAIGLGSIFGRIVLSGFLTERIRNERILFICFFVQSSSILILLFFKDIQFYYLFGLLFGFFYSGWVPIFPMILGDFYGLKALGAIYGFFGTSFSVAAIIGPILAGYLFDKTGSYFYPFLIAIIICYLAATLTFFIKKPQRKQPA